MNIDEANWLRPSFVQLDSMLVAATTKQTEVVDLNHLPIFISLYLPFYISTWYDDEKATQVPFITAISIW